MSVYFHLHGSESEPVGLAVAPTFTPIVLLPGDGSPATWRLVTFSLARGELTDFQANDRGLRLCSERLRAIIDRHASGTDNIQWLPVRVAIPDGEERRYYAMHFPMASDILDRQRSLFAGAAVVRPCFRARAIHRHRVFSYAGSRAHVVVSEMVRREIVRSACTGVGFYAACVTGDEGSV